MSGNRLVSSSSVAYPSKRRIVGHFVYFITGIESLERYFSQFGQIKQANVMKYTDRQVSRGFGFCIFENPESAEEAMKIREHTIDGRKVPCVCNLLISRWTCAGHFRRKWLLLPKHPVDWYAITLIRRWATFEASCTQDLRWWFECWYKRSYVLLLVGCGIYNV